MVAALLGQRHFWSFEIDNLLFILIFQTDSGQGLCQIQNLVLLGFFLAGLLLQLNERVLLLHTQRVRLVHHKS